MITHLKIKNFKALQKADVELKPLSLFTGLNGMGKSTLLQAILLLRQSYLQQTVGSQGLLLNGSLIELGKGSDVLSEGADEELITFEVTTDKYTEPFSWVFKCSNELDILPVSSYSQPSTVKQSSESESTKPRLRLMLQNSPRYLPFLMGRKTQYLSAERLKPQISYPTSTSAVLHLKQLGKHGEYTTHYLNVFGDQKVGFINMLYSTDKISTESIPNTLIQQISAWLGEISPGLRLKTSDFSKIGLVGVGYEYKTSTGYTQAFSPANVGFGMSYILPVLTAILSAQKGSLLIIENPESHLHPKGQSRLGELMALAAHNDIQLLVETHSDHVLNGVRVAVKKHKLNSERIGLYFFERDLSKESNHQSIIIQPKLDDDGRIDIWPNGFFDEWENNMMELL